MFFCCECVLSGRGLCDEVITHPEEYWRAWCVVCDLETSRMRSWSTGGCWAKRKEKVFYSCSFGVMNYKDAADLCAALWSKPTVKNALGMLFIALLLVPSSTVASFMLHVNGSCEGVGGTCVVVLGCG
jgi:hypothetical protein